MSLNPVYLTGDRATVTLAANSQAAAIPPGCRQVRVVNDTGGKIYLTSGVTSPTASTGHTAMQSSATEVFSLEDSHRFIAAYSTGSGAVHFLFGPGE